jgi:hypothetical protein
MNFTDKDPSEVVRLGVDFTNLLDTDETILTATVTVRTTSGVDQPTMVSGNEDIASPIVRQLITGGTAGTTYKVSFVVTTTSGQTLVEGANLRVTERD